MMKGYDRDEALAFILRVFGENVQNSKIKSQNAQSLHAPVRTMKSRA